MSHRTNYRDDMIPFELVEKARQAWITAAKEFNFEIETPYYVEIGGIRQELFAFLPQFGSKNGTLVMLTIGPKFKTNAEVFAYSRSKDMFCSSLNVHSYLDYDFDVFDEVLSDWGRFS